MKYFYEAIELTVYPVTNQEFEKIGGVKSKHNRYDSFKRLVGKDAQGNILPVQRKIDYAKKPSLHKCDKRCLNAQGHNCECSCGGVNHGAGNF